MLFVNVIYDIIDTNSYHRKESAWKPNIFSNSGGQMPSALTQTQSNSQNQNHNQPLQAQHSIGGMAKLLTSYRNSLTSEENSEHFDSSRHGSFVSTQESKSTNTNSTPREPVLTTISETNSIGSKRSTDIMQTPDFSTKSRQNFTSKHEIDHILVQQQRSIVCDIERMALGLPFNERVGYASYL